MSRMALGLGEQTVYEVSVCTGMLTEDESSHREHLVYWSEDSIMNIKQSPRLHSPWRPRPLVPTYNSHILP